jgi:hypothetical protein
MARFDKSFRVLSPVGPVYRVNGAKVRKASIDGAAGWHGLVYPGLVPKKEIWIEKMVGGANEERFILAHEMTEILLMRVRKWKYQRAHDAANRVERALRKGSNAFLVFSRFIKRYFPRAHPDAVTRTGAELAEAYQSYR